MTRAEALGLIHEAARLLEKADPSTSLGAGADDVRAVWRLADAAAGAGEGARAAGFTNIGGFDDPTGRGARVVVEPTASDHETEAK